MGEVYRATDTKLGRDVALEVLPAEMAPSRERLERFQREAKALAAPDHPGVVSDGVERRFHPYPYIATHCPFLAPRRGTPAFARVARRAAERVAAFRAQARRTRDRAAG